MYLQSVYFASPKGGILCQAPNLLLAKPKFMFILTRKLSRLSLYIDSQSSNPFYLIISFGSSLYSVTNET